MTSAECPMCRSIDVSHTLLVYHITLSASLLSIPFHHLFSAFRLGNPKFPLYSIRFTGEIFHCSNDYLSRNDSFTYRCTSTNSITLTS